MPLQVNGSINRQVGIDLQTGTILDERFIITGVLGEGGMGVVYRAKQTGLNREVAIKVLHALKESDDFDRFRREAAILSRLSHPAIPHFHHFGIWGSTPYFVMELLSGQTLSQKIDKEGKIDAREAIRITRVLADALEYAHSAGIVHRDLTPANVMLLDDGGIKIMDFGLSRVADQKLTNTGALIGTPRFMSPEQCRGQKVDERSDVYSLSCVLYNMIAGEPPFDADYPIAILRMHSETPHVPLREKLPNEGLPEGIDEVIAKGLNKAPDARFQSMKDLERALSMVADNRSAELTCRLTTNPQHSPKGFKNVVFIATAAISTILIAGIILFKPVSLPDVDSGDAWVHIRKAQSFLSAGKREEALSMLKQLAPTIRSENRLTQARYYVALSKVESDAQNYKAAIESASDAVKLASGAGKGDRFDAKLNCVHVLLTAAINMPPREGRELLRKARKLLVECVELGSAVRTEIQYRYVCYSQLAYIDAVLHKDELGEDISALAFLQSKLDNQQKGVLPNQILESAELLLRWGELKEAKRFAELANQWLDPNTASSTVKFHQEVLNYRLAVLGADSKTADQHFAAVKQLEESGALVGWRFFEFMNHSCMWMSQRKLFKEALLLAKDALNRLSSLERKNPEHIHALYNIQMSALIALGKYDEADKVLDQSLQVLNTENEIVSLQSFRFNMAGALQSAKKYPEAIKILKKYPANYPRTLQAKTCIIALMQLQSLAYRNEGNTNAVEQISNEMVHAVDEALPLVGRRKAEQVRVYNLFTAKINGLVGLKKYAEATLVCDEAQRILKDEKLRAQIEAFRPDSGKH